MPGLAKATAAAALSWSGLNHWLGRKPRAAPLVLGYHRVVESVAAMGELTLPAMMVSQAMLRAHLEWVGRRFRIVSLDELGALLERGAPCGNLAAVTFDDGYRDVHDYAMPVLEQMGVPAAVFVVSSLIGTRSPPLHDQLYQVVSEASAARGAMPPALVTALAGRHHDQDGGPEVIRRTVRALLASVSAADLRRMVNELRLKGTSTPPPKELATADWHALARMQRAGMIIGSHTHTHALLIHEDDATIVEELSRSRSAIEKGLGTAVRHFAYPDGRFSPQVVRAVATAGYQFAYTICDHRDRAKPLLTIPRVMLWEGSCTGMRGDFSPSLMHCHATAVLPFPSRCRGNHGVSSRWQSC